MTQIFKTKIIRIGKSFGVLIPKKVLKQNKIKPGDEIKMSLLNKENSEVIEKLMGIAKGARPFKRENTDRI